MSYSNIFFSNNYITGIIILLTTFIYPLHGIFGLLGALLSSSWAYLLGSDRQSIKNGIFGFNGVLVGLAVGFYYNLNASSIILLLTATLFLALISIFLNHVFYKYYGLPSLSMPFNITASLVMLAGDAQSLLTPASNMPIIDVQIPFLADITVFLSSFSAILFQPNPLSGLFIAVAILINSRIAFTLMTAGFLSAFYIHTLSGLDMNIITEKLLGFNYMYAALAIGGIFCIPSAGSLILGMLGAMVTVIITAGCLILLPAPLAPLAIPFNITVYLFLYALRIRTFPALKVALSVNSGLTPEENLRKHSENLKQWKKPTITISLPFHGRWKVTQGINGQFTHKENWAFAYDFQAVDFKGKTYKSNAKELEDYYSFGLPVTAPASGKIIYLKQDVPDNKIGMTNKDENWGNYIIIEHAAGYFSCLAHLKHGSVKVTVGQDVRKREVIASCGNSGRSPYPHLHLQFQTMPQIGSHSINFDFSNILVTRQASINDIASNGSPQIYLPMGKVKENSIVCNIEPAIDYEEFFPYSVHQVWKYQCFNNNIETKEFWRGDIDFYGNTMIKSSPINSNIYYRLYDGVLNVLAVDGDLKTRLSLLGVLISEIPFAACDNEITWKSSDPAYYGIHPMVKAVIDVFSLFGINLMSNCNYQYKIIKDEIRLNIKSLLYLNIVVFSIKVKELPDVEMVFKRKIGLNTLKIGSNTILQLKK